MIYVLIPPVVSERHSLYFHVSLLHLFINIFPSTSSPSLYLIPLCVCVEVYEYIYIHTHLSIYIYI